MTDQDMLRAIYPQLRRFAAIVGPPEVGPDDLLHDAIVRTLRNGPLARLDDPAAYLRRAIVNEASNARRSLGRARRARLRLFGRTAEAEVDNYPSDLAYLQELDAVSKAVLYLHEVDGFSFAEVGDALGLGEANARKIASRARSRIRDILKEAAS